MTNRYRFIDELDEKGKPQHLHTLDLKPLMGSSTVVGVLAKNLTWWAVGMGLTTLGWSPINDKKTKKRVPTEDRLRVVEEWLATNPLTSFDGKTWLKALDEAYYAHDTVKNQKAESGTDMHLDLENYVRHCIAANQGKPISGIAGVHSKEVELFANWAVKNVDVFLLSEANVYSETLWVGGELDVLFRAKSGKNLIGDFKSSKEAYLSHFLQDALYGIELAENGAFDKEGNKIYEPLKVDGYAVFPFGGEQFEPAIRWDRQALEDGARACVILHKLNTN